VRGKRVLAVALLLAATCTAAEPTRDELLQQAEAALSRGAVFEALRGLDRAAALEHASDIELGLVRAYMQLGHYRRAMAFAAHTAGTHRDDARGVVLYAWLLAAGGQGAFAQRQLDEADARLPGHALVAEGRRQLGLPAPMPSAARCKRRRAWRRTAHKSNCRPARAWSRPAR
jgi:thioredoxin-like negative regulator of GroEL